MGLAICHHEGSFLIWSSVVDAPILYDCTEDDVRDYIQRKHGEAGLLSIERDIETARRKGTSSCIHDSLEEMVLFNHAGPDGQELAYEDVIRFYFVEKRTPDGTAKILDPARFD